MVYPLLAATALGAIGLYLMLPRERASWSRLGVLLGALALAGFLLFLVRTVAVNTAGLGPPVYFYLFAIIMIAGAVGVICQPRPVYAALYFVLVTLAGAGIFVLLMADFMAIVLIIIYAGAILVTYVFVIMLASQSATGTAASKSRSPEYDRRASEPFVAVLVAFLLVGAVLQALYPQGDSTIAVTSRPPDILMARSLGDTAESDPALTPSNVQVVGANLYSHYPLSLELAGILLTIALVGAVVIARKNTAQQDSVGTGKLPTE